jgi:hypothetical protein
MPATTPSEKLEAFRSHVTKIRDLVQQAHEAALEANEECLALITEADELMQDVPAARRAFFNPIKEQAEYLSQVVQAADGAEFSWGRPLEEGDDLVALAEFAVEQAERKLGRSEPPSSSSRFGGREETSLSWKPLTP